MTNLEIQKTIIKETQELPFDILQEVLDFIQFVKMKKIRNKIGSVSENNEWQKELEVLSKNSLAHLEEEFADYKEMYPHE